MKILPLPVKRNKSGKRVADITTNEYYRQIAEEVLEAHGVCFPPSHCTPVKSFIKKDGVGLYFETLAQLARFLAPKCHYAFSSVYRCLKKRPEIFHGWQISYLPPDTWNSDKQKISNRMLRAIR